MSMLDFYTGAENLDLEGGPAGDLGEGSGDAIATEVAELAVVIEEQSTAIAELVDEVAELDDSVEELEEVIDGTESLLQSGQWNPVAYGKLYARGVTLVNKLGGDIDPASRDGLESFGDAASAEMMTRAGQESFVEKAKEWGRKAIEYIKHIFNMVINFFVSLWSQADALQRRSAQLKKRLDEGAKIKEEIKLGGWNIWYDYAKNGLKDSDKIKTFENTNKAIAAFVDVGKNVQGVTLAAFKTAYSSLVTAIKSDATAVGKAQAKKNGSTNVIIGVFNGVRIRATYNDMDPKDLGEAAAAARSVKVSIGKDPDAKKMQSGTAKSKMDKSALQGRLSYVNATLASTRTNDVAKKFTNAERDRVVGSLNAIKAGDDDRKSEISKQVALVRAIFSSGATLAQVNNKLLLQEARALLDGIAAHIGF